MSAETRVMNRIRFIFILLTISLIFFRCQRDKMPWTPENMHNYMASPGEGILKTSKGQSYLLYSEDNYLCEESHPAPDSIVAISENHLKDHFGQDYFKRYFQFRVSVIFSENEYMLNLGYKYKVSFYYQISIDDFNTWLIASTYHDSAGQILTDEGVVDRMSDPTLGMPFQIDDEEAVAIAKENNFMSGYFPWHVNFRFDSNRIRYVWLIKNQTERFSGSSILIDANTGNIVNEDHWFIMDAGGW